MSTEGNDPIESRLSRLRGLCPWNDVDPEDVVSSMSSAGFHYAADIYEPELREAWTKNRGMIPAEQARLIADTQMLRELQYPEHTYFSLSFSVHGFTFTFLRMYSRINQFRFSLLEVDV